MRNFRNCLLIRPLLGKWWGVVLFLVSGVCWGQDYLIVTPQERLSEVEEDNEIVYEYQTITRKLPSGIKDRDTKLIKLHFISKSSSDTCASFDIDRNNPYQNFNYPTTNQKVAYCRNFQRYDVSKENPQKIIDKYFPDTGVSIVNPCFSAISSYLVPLQETHNPKNKHFAVIAYTLVGQLNTEDCPIEFEQNYKEVLFQTTLLIINHKGEIISKLVSQNTNCHAPIITEDGRYVVFHYGDLQANHRNLEDGYKIYDLEKQTIIANKRFNHINGCFIRYGMIICSYNNNSFVPSEKTYELYDMANRILYSRSFERELYAKAKHFGPKGIAIYKNLTQENFKNKKGIDSLFFSYENDFKQQNF